MNPQLSPEFPIYLDRFNVIIKSGVWENKIYWHLYECKGLQLSIREILEKLNGGISKPIKKDKVISFGNDYFQEVFINYLMIVSITEITSLLDYYYYQYKLKKDRLDFVEFISNNFDRAFEDYKKIRFDFGPRKKLVTDWSKSVDSRKYLLQPKKIKVFNLNSEQIKAIVDSLHKEEGDEYKIHDFFNNKFTSPLKINIGIGLFIDLLRRILFPDEESRKRINEVTQILDGKMLYYKRKVGITPITCDLLYTYLTDSSKTPALSTEKPLIDMFPN